jgi:hypothetical protein
MIRTELLRNTNPERNEETVKEPRLQVPSEQRIATFGQDGTLWSEQPVVQGMFLTYKLEQMAAEDPSIRTQKPFKPAFEHDAKYLHAEGIIAMACGRVN